MPGVPVSYEGFLVRGSQATNIRSYFPERRNYMDINVNSFCNPSVNFLVFSGHLQYASVSPLYCYSYFFI